MKANALDDFAAEEVDCFLMAIMFERTKAPITEWIKIRKRNNELKKKIQRL